MERRYLMKNFDSIKYTWKHRKSFLETEKRLLGHNTLRGYFHDLDKIFLKLFMDPKKVQVIHRSYSRHHEIKAKTEDDFIQMIIDWECARFTKPDKPLNARETLNKYYPNLKEKIEPLLNHFDL
jgi:hypothetical protein